MTEIDTSTEVGAIRDALTQLHGFTTVDAATLGKAPVLVLPEGKSLVSAKKFLDEYLVKPARRRGTSTARDVDSFIALVDRFSSNETAVFVAPDRRAPSLTAVFDYHPSDEDATKADWLEHRATYAPELSDEWKAWTAKNNTFMGQGDFAAFVEEHITDLIVPNLDDPKLKTFADLVEGSWATPADMMKLSRGMSVNVESKVKNAQTLSSGEVSVVFEEVHTNGAGEPLKVATLFTIAIPVFYAGDLYRIAARLRYRVQGGSISWLYQLVRPELVFDDAFKGLVEKVKKETNVPVFAGTPEK